MFGFSGSNIEPWLQFFKGRRNEIELTFVCREFEVHGIRRSMYPWIRTVQLYPYGRYPAFIRRLFSWANILRLVLKSRMYDLFILQGLYDPFLSLLLFKLVRSRRRFVQVWNISSHRRAHQEPLLRSSRQIMKILERSDGILFSWEPNRLDFVDRFPQFEYKTKSMVWGLPRRYLDLSHRPESERVMQLLEPLTDDDILIFWPRSIQRNNRHDVLLKALGILRTRTLPETWKRLKVILLGGTGSGELVCNVLNQAKELDMPGMQILTGTFIEKDYLMALYDRADIFVNLADADQISLGILEAAGRMTALLLSDIPSYRYLAEYGIKVYYTENKPESVAKALEELIKRLGSVVLNEEFQKNRNAVVNHFDLEQAFTAIIDYCLEERHV